MHAAEDWEYYSLRRWHFGQDCNPRLLTLWPIRRPPNWTQRVNEALTGGELESIQNSVARNQPYGNHEWVDETCDRTGLWATIRPLGRPRKKPQIKAVQIRDK